jgi:hypothetical protein
LKSAIQTSQINMYDGKCFLSTEDASRIRF